MKTIKDFWDKVEKEDICIGFTSEDGEDYNLYLTEPIIGEDEDKFNDIFVDVVKDNLRIIFKDLTKEQIEHLHKAEAELRLAGVSFDTGFDLQNNRRDWEFDSLKGAEVELK